MNENELREVGELWNSFNATYSKDAGNNPTKLAFKLAKKIPILIHHIEKITIPEINDVEFTGWNADGLGYKVKDGNELRLSHDSILKMIKERDEHLRELHRRSDTIAELVEVKNELSQAIVEIKHIVGRIE